MAAFNWHFQAAEAKEALRERHNYIAFLRASCTRDSDYDGALIVFAELVGNVVRHAEGPIHLSLCSDPRGNVTLQISDTGSPFEFAPSLPGSTSENGRGLYIVSQFCRNVSVTHAERGNVVRVQLPVVLASDSAPLD
jgi:anti-sigma regulatory factor (Ser/Thr protein kinase)